MDVFTLGQQGALKPLCRISFPIVGSSLLLRCNSWIMIAANSL